MLIQICPTPQEASTPFWRENYKILTQYLPLFLLKGFFNIFDLPALFDS